MQTMSRQVDSKKLQYITLHDPPLDSYPLITCIFIPIHITWSILELFFVQHNHSIGASSTSWHAWLGMTYWLSFISVYLYRLQLVAFYCPVQVTTIVFPRKHVYAISTRHLVCWASFRISIHSMTEA